SYQLTHDYMVPALRQWLTRKQKETWHGRAELLLEERAAQWNAGRQRRFLPSLPEYLFFWFGVPRAKQKPQEQALMKTAARHHGLTCGLVFLLLLMGAVFLQQYVSSVRQAPLLERGKTLVDRALTAPPADVPAAVRDLKPSRKVVLPLLRSSLQ